MAELSEACRKHLAARWDDGPSTLDDARFEKDMISCALDDSEMAVISLDIEDFSEFPELRGYTAVAISQDGSVAYLTKEEAEEEDE